MKLIHERGSYYYSEAWNGLRGKTIENTTVILKGFGDIHPFRDGLRFLAQTVFVNSDMNFVYYWINTYNFPNMKDLYLMSHPSEPILLRRTNYNTYLSNFYEPKRLAWAQNNSKVISMDHTKMEAEKII